MNAETPVRSRVLWGLAAVGLVALLLLVRISAFGIWDPWELGTADAARKLASGKAADAGRASVWMVSRGFALFGVHEWAGRLPIALAGLATVLLAFALGSRFGDTRTGVYAALAAGTSPLFVFNARAMLGEAPGFAAQALVAWCALNMLLPAVSHDPARAPSRRRAYVWLSATVLAIGLAVWVRGALLGALPPLAAAAALAWFGARRPGSGGRVLTWLTTAGLVALLAVIARDVLRDAQDPSLWLGGGVVSVTPPTFDQVLEEVFHAFAPWSALLPLALGRSWLRTANVPDTAEPQEPASATALGVFAAVWAFAGYAAQTLFVSRYGAEVAFLPVVALALLVATFLRALERENRPSWALALSAVFLVGLILRDYALYPSSPVRGMPLASFEVPDVFNPKRIWSVLLAAFAVCAFFGLGTTRQSVAALDLAAPYRFVATQWRRGLPFRLWLVALGFVLAGIVVFGVLAYAIPEQLRMPSLAVRWVRRLVFLPAVLCAAVAGAQLLLLGFAKLGRFRFVPMLASGVLVGAYAAQGFLPALSEHFSPREVYSTYNALASDGEELGEYNVGGRAAAYYAEGPVIELDSMDRLLDHLVADSRRWAAFPASELPEIDRRYRQRTRSHLFVADARSARVVLATNRPVSGRRDENPLSKVVLTQAPGQIEHRVSVNFENRVELLGYDLDLPHDGYVGAGESFTLRWYFRAITSGPHGYKVFVHIDGQGKRIHGDHEPVDGKYPLRLWEAGDVIVDEQTVDVPASSRAGEYTIYMGFYSGETRLRIESGPNDGVDRAIAGVLRIQ